jgi:hypothetical protein
MGPHGAAPDERLDQGAAQDEVAASVVRDWQKVRVAERLDWLYAYDATAEAI